jgi:dienelactone hydrolase
MAAGVALASLLQTPSTAAPDFATLARLFDYDGRPPIDIQDKVVAERNGVTIHDITYASPVSGRVPAYLLVPKGKGSFAAMLFGHWGGGDRTEFIAEAERYARAGAVCLLPSYPWVRPAEWRREVNRFDKAEEDKKNYIQAVVDLRRGIDLLLERKDVDRARLGYIGHSYGAQWGAILAAVDRRIKAAVLVAGVPDLDCLFMRDDPETIAFRKSLPPGQIEAYLKAQSVLSAVNYVGHASPVPLLFQFAAFEPNFGRDAMERYYVAAKEPKRILWYDTGHEMADPQAAADRFAFLSGPLGLKDISER